MICVAGHSTAYIEKLIDCSKEDVALDYREGDDALVGNLCNAAGGKPLLYALDAVFKPWNYPNLFKVLAKGTKINFVRDVL